MKTITVARFNVSMDEPTTSYRMEKELEPITEELNNTRLIVNKATWLRNRDAMAAEVDRLTDICCREAGYKFRPNASADVSDLLFERMKLPVQRKTKGKGAASVDKETLQALAGQGHEICRMISEAREAITKLSQLKAWQVYAEEGSVQANWDSFGTPHGRYTADSPNLQNRITEIRETCEAPKGYKLLSSDLGQAEYVTWASLSKDTLLTEAFASGVDFHRKMYTEIEAASPGLNIKVEDERKAGKTLNFALLYLMQVRTLAQRLSISYEQAALLLNVYRARAPQATTYIDNYLDEVRRTEQASTLFGRLRKFPGIKQMKGSQLHEAQKTAWHHHNAGTAAEVLKIKQVRAHKALRKQGLTQKEVSLVVQFHDELIFIVKDELLDQVKGIVAEAFDRPIGSMLPFKTDTREGQNWLDISK